MSSGKVLMNIRDSIFFNHEGFEVKKTYFDLTFDFF